MLPIGNELRNVLASFADLEWARCGPILNIVDCDQSHRIHRTVWRYKQSHEHIEQLVKEAVESFEGRVPWQMTKHSRNWIIAPTHAPIHNDAPADASTDELGQASNKDLLTLAAHIQEYVQSRIGKEA